MTNSLLTYYQLLDISTDASNDDILSAYKIKAKEYHPDKNGGHASATKLFQLINEAKDILVDPVKRLEYDYSIGVRQKPSANSNALISRENNSSTTAKVFGFAALALIFGYLLGRSNKD